MIYSIDPGYSLGNESDNLLLSLKLAKTYRYGLRSSSEFNCTFEPPVASGKDPEGGTFSYIVTYKSGKTATLEGIFTKSSIDAQHTDINGESTGVTLTRAD